MSNNDMCKPRIFKVNAKIRIVSFLANQSETSLVVPRFILSSLGDRVEQNMNDYALAIRITIIPVDNKQRGHLRMLVGHDASE